MTQQQFLEDIPASPSVTEYDRAHMTLYMRLLDATNSDAEFYEIMQVLFALDAEDDPERCRRIYQTHLARARWMAADGHRQLNGH